jgi:hypothetical protein
VLDETDETNFGFDAMGTISVPVNLWTSDDELRSKEEDSPAMPIATIRRNPLLQNMLVLSAAGLLSPRLFSRFYG